MKKSLHRPAKKPKPELTWYERWIEEPIRPLVRFLRENGYNTTCSCGHEMWVECWYSRSSLVELEDLLLNHGFTDFRLEATIARTEAGKAACLTIWLPKPDGKISELARSRQTIGGVSNL